MVIRVHVHVRVCVFVCARALIHTPAFPLLLQEGVQPACEGGGGS